MRFHSFVLASLLLVGAASALTPANPGDLNGDNRVDVADVFVVVSCLGQNAVTCQSGRADPNNDGAVNIFDFIQVSRSWGSTYSGAPVGLVAAYGFEEGSGTAVTDSSGNANTGTITTATRTTGRNGQGLSFDGTSSLVTIPSSNSLNIVGPITLEAWVNTNDPDYGNLIMKNGINGGYGLFLEARTYQYYIGSWSGTTTQAVSANTWSHVALTADGTTINVYRDGTLVWSRAQTQTISSTTSAVILGSVNGQGYFQGLMDDVRIYNRALSQAEIQADMNTPVGGTPAPDTTNPTVALSAPANGATVSGATTVSATASDNIAVAGVQFLLDGSNLGTEDTTSPYSISWATTGAANGAHTLSAIARDAAGNTANAATRSVTVSNAAPDTTPPTVSVTAPANGATIASTTTVTATASDNVAVQSVQFLLDGANLGSADTTSPYSVSLNPASYSNGAHTLTARATDTSALTATSAGVSITISNPADTTPPVPTITAPTAGQQLAFGTTSATLTVSTNEAATCRYSTSSSATYGTMTLTMSGAGSTSHTAAVSVTNGGSYTYYVACQDAASPPNPMTGSVSRSFTVSNTPSTGGTVLFSSDWSTATGTTNNALLDGSKWSNRWGGNGLLTIVPASGHGFPAGMTNVLQVLHGTQSFDWVQANNKWTLPAIGESRAYRIYLRSEFGSVNGGWAATHPLESQGTDGGISGNFYALHVGSDTANTFPFSFATAAGWPWNYLIVGSSGGSDVTRLNKQTTYRLEWKWTRRGTNTYDLDMRIYGADDSTLLYDRNSIYGWGGGTLASHSTGYPVDSAFITGIRVGLNGGFGASGNQYFYWGGFAVCDDWCGAYTP